MPSLDQSWAVVGSPICVAMRSTRASADRRPAWLAQAPAQTWLAQAQAAQAETQRELEYAAIYRDLGNAQAAINPNSPEQAANNPGSPKRRPRTIEAALAYLEKASPEALATHRPRLVALINRAATGEPARSAVAAVLDCDSLFLQILDFCGAVGVRRRNFSSMIGDRESRPMPRYYDRDIYAAAALASLNRRWREFTQGDSARDYLRAQERAARERSALRFRKLAADASAAAFHRLVAAAAADDVATLQSKLLLDEACRELAAYEWRGDESDDTEDEDEVRRRDGLDHSRTHNNLYELFTESMLDRYADSDSAWGLGEVLALCLLNAACEGAENAVGYLVELGASGSYCFDCDHGTDSLIVLLDKALRDHGAPALRGLTVMDRHLRSTDPWWARHLPEVAERRARGSNGSWLHLAAARGNRGLVEFLLRVGVPAELPLHDALDRSYSTYRDEDDPPLPGRSYTPADWARNRGEVEIAELLDTYEHPEFPRLIAGEAYARGTLVRYNVEKGFGFIEPECDESEDPLEDDEHDDVFVHVSALYAACAPQDRPARRAFIPQPGQRLAFVVGKGKGGRPQAVRVANARRLSYIEVPTVSIHGLRTRAPLDREAATRAWDEYSSRCRAHDDDGGWGYY